MKISQHPVISQAISHYNQKEHPPQLEQYASDNRIELNLVRAVSPLEVRIIGMLAGPAVMIEALSTMIPRLPMVLESILYRTFAVFMSVATRQLASPLILPW